MPMCEECFFVVLNAPCEICKIILGFMMKYQLGPKDILELTQGNSTQQISDEYNKLPAEAKLTLITLSELISKIK